MVENGIFSGTCLVNKQVLKSYFSDHIDILGSLNILFISKIFNNALVGRGSDCTTHCLQYGYEILLKILNL